ncbi:MAG: hypothetical protein ACYDCQ_13950 [Dehalococcoidia bacterium]
MAQMDVLHDAGQIAAAATRAALQSALGEYTRALAVLQEVAAREPLTSLELNAALKRTRAVQDDVHACLQLQRRGS